MNKSFIALVPRTNKYLSISEKVGQLIGLCECIERDVPLGLFCRGIFFQNVQNTKANNRHKLRRLGPTNQIINTLDSKPSEFGRRFSDDSDFNVEIKLQFK